MTHHNCVSVASHMTCFQPIRVQHLWCVLLWVVRKGLLWTSERHSCWSVLEQFVHHVPTSADILSSIRDMSHVKSVSSLFTLDVVESLLLMTSTLWFITVDKNPLFVFNAVTLLVGFYGRRLACKNQCCRGFIRATFGDTVFCYIVFRCSRSQSLDCTAVELMDHCNKRHILSSPQASPFWKLYSN